jgi:uncharacterized protein (TIGR03067 family)
MIRLPLSLSLLLIAAAAVAVPFPTEKKTAEAPSIDGTYQIVNIEDAGRPAQPPQELAKMAQARVKFEKNTMTMSMLEGPSMSANLVINYAKSPITIDIVPNDGPEKGRTIRGICKREGAVLTLCATEHGDADRPTEFKAAKGFVMMTLKIAK